MTTKQQNWQPLIQATEDLLADFPDILSLIKQTWQDHSPSSAPVTDASPSATPAPVPEASASATHKGSYFFFFYID